MERQEGVARPVEAHGLEMPHPKGNKEKELDNKIKHLKTRLKQEKDQLKSAKADPEGRLKYPKMAIKKLTSCLYDTSKIEKKINRTLAELDSANTEKKDLTLLSRFNEYLNTGQHQEALQCMREINNINIQDEYGNNPFIYACQSGNFDCLELLLQKPELKISPELLLKKAPNSNSPLFELLQNDRTREQTFLHLGNLWGQDNVADMAIKEFGELVDAKGIDWFIDSFRPLLANEIFSGTEMQNRIMNELNSLTVQTIVQDLDANSTVQLRKFINIETEASNKEIIDVITTLKQVLYEKSRPLSPSWENLEFKLQRFEQLSEIHIEREQMSAQQLLKMASIIEDDLIDEVAGKVLPIREGPPRKLLKTEGQEIVIFSSLKSSSPLIKGEGAFKKVKSAVRIPLDRLSKEYEHIIYAKLKENSDSSQSELKKEWDILSKFKGKDGFVQGYDIFSYESKTGELKLGVLFKAYDGDLEKFSNENNNRVKLEIDEQLLLAQKLVTAIDTMHNENVINRDLKLPNVLYKENEDGNKEIAISDFGTALDISKVSIGSNIMERACTPSYLAPEIKYGYISENNPQGWKRCEVWSTGIMLYNLLFDKEFEYPPSLPSLPDPPDYNPSSEEYEQQYDDYLLKMEKTVRERRELKPLYQASFEAKHERQVEEPLRMLLTKQRTTPEKLSREDKYKIVVYRMLSANPEERLTLPEANQMLANI